MAKSSLRLSEGIIIYQVWLIAWIDPEGKQSALQRAIDFLPYLAKLDVDYLWLSPIYLSPWRDHGYDVASYKVIDKRFGTMEDFEQLVEVARQYGIEIMMDLVLNHTSTAHPWFKRRPDCYCWSMESRPGWVNLFDGGSSWEYDEAKAQFYLHSFDASQADLNWYPEGPESEPNSVLVQEFQYVVDFWRRKGVGGFRLDATQVINKDVAKDYFAPIETVTKYADMATRVISAIFDRPRQDVYLLVECLDLSGSMVKFYHDHAPVDGVMNNAPTSTVIVTKDQLVAERGLGEYIAAVQKSAASCPEGYASSTESHDGPRFTSAAGISSRDAIDVLFGEYQGQKFCSPRTIVMYQGQELGLQNPTKEKLSDYDMVKLDAQTEMRFRRGELLDDLRPTSRANARVLFSMDEYARQDVTPGSCLDYVRGKIRRWRGSVQTGAAAALLSDVQAALDQ